MKVTLDHHTLKVLEFQRIKDIFKTYLESEIGLSKIENLHPEVSGDSTKKGLKETSEIKDILLTVGEIPIKNLKEPGNIFKILRKKNAVLDAPQVLDIADILSVSRKIKEFFTQLENSYPYIEIKIKEIFTSPSLSRRIDKTIDKQGEIVDDASPELKKIRRHIKRKREEIRDKLNVLMDKRASVVQEPIITVRDDRYVLPLKSNFNRSVKGIVHGISTSKATVFVEPLEIVDLNNEIINLGAEEQKEKFRILKGLTEEIRERFNEIEKNIDILAEIDLITAKAKYSIEFNSVEPVINAHGKIKLIQARNPFLEWERRNSKKNTVPIDINLGKDFNILVITGPNTGGKTVSLKTLGLLCMMVQSGMHIPVKDGSEISIFKKIFADIGDEQSIQQNLSTFSSHTKQIIKIIKESDSSSLVLLDELGAGTDPSEGAALGIAILDNLRERGIKTLATTHHNSLKVFAHSYKDVENASVEFDSKTLQPKYRLIYGYSGKSSAFDIAKNLGLPQGLISRAIGEIKQEKDEVDRLIDRLETQIRDIEELKKEIFTEKYEIQEKKSEQLLLIEELKREKSLFSKEANKFLKEAKRELENIVNDLRKNSKKGIIKFPQKDFALWKSRIDDLQKTPYEEKRSPLEPKIGEIVRINSLGCEGVIKSYKSPSIVEVEVDFKKIQVPLEDLGHSSKAGDDQSRVAMSSGIFMKKDFLKDFSVELNVIGNRIDEALPKVDKYLDNAKISGLNKVRIIHGKGTGRLKRAITAMLQEHPHVKNFYSSGMNEGGWGATIVEISN
ncbi:MAG TPA: endonuclease MutS2 [Nitrospinota bacterium]|nr:endonuclease MutS2 [Nitrospinota bacterium]